MEVQANSRPNPLSRRAAAALMTVALAACAVGDATGPEDEEQDYSVTVRLQSVMSTATCEEAFTNLDGGEFVWRVHLSWPDGGSEVLHASDLYPSLAGHKTLRENQSVAINRSAARTIRGTVGTTVSLFVTASEVDFDIFGGNPRADIRMSEAVARAFVAYDESGWQPTNFTIRVQPADGCNFSAAFSVLATPVEGG